MSVQRITRELRKLSAGTRRLRLAATLIVLAIPLSGCGTGALWDKFFAKDDTFVDEPADKLYNEGLYLMNEPATSTIASAPPHATSPCIPAARTRPTRNI